MYVKKIGRRIYTITCRGQRVNESGEFAPYVGVVNTTESLPTIEQLTEHLRKRERDPSIALNEIDTQEHYYKMTVDDFIVHSERTD